MSVKSKWMFKQLVDEMSQEQYERMIAVLRGATVPLPGWRDRLAPDQGGAFPPEAIRVHTPLEGLSQAITLARTARHAQYHNDPKGGVWLQATPNQLRLCGTDNYSASFIDLDASVDVPGTVVVDGRDLWQITEALRKSIPRGQPGQERVALETEGDSCLRISLGVLSHRAALLPRPSDIPTLPPSAENWAMVSDGAALQRAVMHVVTAADYGAGCGGAPTGLDHVGLRAQDGVLTIDAAQRFQAAQASIPIDSGTSFEHLVHYLWLKEIAGSFGTGPIRIGLIPELGEHGMLTAAGDRWTAWTSNTLPWRPRFVPAMLPNSTIVTFHRDDIHRHLIEARRFAESSLIGENSALVRLAASGDALIVSSVSDPESANTGSLRVPAKVTRTGSVNQTYVRISFLLDALRGFEKQDVSIHFGGEIAIYVTTAGSLPEGQPPQLRAIPKAAPTQTRP